MERLTTKSVLGGWTLKVPRQEAVDRLAAYEDTGFEPGAFQAAMQEFANHLKEYTYYRDIGTVEEFRALKEAEQKSRKIEPWVVCFCCTNRKSPVCQKCTRNSFAPCGMEKIDKYVRGIYLRGESHDDK